MNTPFKMNIFFLQSFQFTVVFGGHLGNSFEKKDLSIDVELDRPQCAYLYA